MAAPLDLLILVGLTGVGKSTTLRALRAARPDARLLPDRRTLTDQRLLPEAQRLDGAAIAPVGDRLERFRLTALYRHHHPDGMARVLHEHLEQREDAPGTPLLFDGLRGPDEVRGAHERLPATRFLVLAARPENRIRRLAGRGEAFDRAAASADPIREDGLADRLASLEGAGRHFAPEALAAWARRRGVAPDDLERAVRIVVEESRHYDAEAAEAYLRDRVPADRWRWLDTEAHPPEEVGRRAATWWRDGAP